MELKDIFSVKYEKGSFISVGHPTRLIIKLFGLQIIYNFNKTMFKRIHKAFLKSCDIEDLDYILSQKPQFTHITGIVINREVRIGKNCIIRHNVTLGQGNYNETTKRSYPILGDRVDIGAGAIIIGGINIGDDVKIGAGAVVVKDVPNGATVVGNPARIIEKNNN